MAGIKNRNESTGTRRPSVVQNRDTQYAPPVLLRLPKVRIDNAHTANTEKQFTAVAEGTSPAIAEQPARVNVTAQAASPQVAMPVQDSPKITVAAETQPIQETKGWLDDWTNALIIFLIAVVVFTTAILAMRSPSLNRGKTVPDSTSDRQVVNKTADAMNAASVANDPALGSSKSASTDDSNAKPMALIAEKPINERATQVAQPIKSGSSPSDRRNGPASPSNGLPKKNSTGAKSGAIDLSLGSGDPSLLEADEAVDAATNAWSNDSSDENEFHPSDIAGTSDPTPENVAQESTNPSISETQYAESNIEQLLDLLRRQRAAQGGGFPNGNVARGPSQMGSSQMVSGPMGANTSTAPYVPQTYAPNFVNPGMSYGQQPSMPAAGAPGQNNGYAPRPYQNALPGLIQEMGVAQGYMNPPTAAQPAAFAPNAYNNLAPAPGTPPRRAPYVPIGPGFPNQP